MTKYEAVVKSFEELYAIQSLKLVNAIAENKVLVKQLEEAKQDNKELRLKILSYKNNPELIEQEEE